MSPPTTVEELRALAERDVEVGGRVYRVRRVSVFERFRIFGKLSQVPDSGVELTERERARQIELSVTPQQQAEFLSCAMVDPHLSPEEVYLIPDGDIQEILEAVRQLSVPVPVPFDGGH